ncbi:MAG: aspartate--ammonia ligase [Spirochaetes bacterium]|uniref:Aspartate--ammonia ligase n=1 Tax=Candidatus Ornithospirochaeta stercoravium TaxID=2840897 RepID=A0A9D9IC75_9SPIO|nr:aspartate--ammonia ligase [Candidatus Ornithospirochaeta stercoravium]
MYFPEGYKPLLSQHETEKAIKAAKDIFERELSGALRLSRVTSPLFVPSGSGINDDLNGIEAPVSFSVKNLSGEKMEIIQSLAKWKRMALADYSVKPGRGIYTDMNALRPDDDIDAIHSIYVDQWDWEKVMKDDERNIDYLKATVRNIYSAIKRTAFLLEEDFRVLHDTLPENITFVHTEDAAAEYPSLTPQERERELAKRYGAVFLIGIGYGNPPHSGRAPDYDDWSTETENGRHGLNGDIIVWDTVRNDSLELSSMGIRVNKEALLRQLEIRNCMERKDLYWHKRLLAGDYPQTIGGGIGQSRLCMFLLHKAHIGEVQASVWPESARSEAKSHGFNLL